MGVELETKKGFFLLSLQEQPEGPGESFPAQLRVWQLVQHKLNLQNCLCSFTRGGLQRSSPIISVLAVASSGATHGLLNVMAKSGNTNVGIVTQCHSTFMGLTVWGGG